MTVPGRSRSITTRAGPSVGAADGPVEPLAREPGVVAVSAETRPVARVGAGSVMDAPGADLCGRGGAGRCGVEIRADGRAGRRGAGGPVGPLCPTGCSRPAGCRCQAVGRARRTSDQEIAGRVPTRRPPSRRTVSLACGVTVSGASFVLAAGG